MDQVERRRSDHRGRRHDLDQQPERGEGARDGDRLGQHHLAGRRALLHRGGEPRRLADRQRRLHAQLALCLRARQRRRQPDQGQASTWRRCPRAAGTTSSAATLGGWNLAVSKYSPNPDAATDLALYMASTEFQKQRGAASSATCRRSRRSTTTPRSPRQQPLIPRWKDIFLNAVPRPSAPTKVAYNEVSNKFWTAVHEILAGTTPARRRPRAPRARPRRDEGRRLVAPLPADDPRSATRTPGRRASRPPASRAQRGGRRDHDDDQRPAGMPARAAAPADDRSSRPSGSGRPGSSSCR